MSYTELHFHLLPGIDDGPSSMEESEALAAGAAADGTGTIVATPHVHPQFDTDVSSLPERVREVSARLAARHIAIRVLCGGELAHDMVRRLSQAEFETIAHGPPGRRWLLLEAPLEGLDHAYTEAAKEVRDRGFAVVVAHPERALRWSDGSWETLERELAVGSVVQINAWSVAGLYGEMVRATALWLLRTAPRAVVASDAHGGTRMPALGLGLDALTAARIPDPTRLLRSVPNALLEQGLTVEKGSPLAA
ncbi:MAG TPA: CpsB/CapC family capsule biosynthesis tyrosine phosphatase [Solirubrobacteraceae bacterium]|jgi:protein-tyrosine phosphatase